MQDWQKVLNARRLEGSADLFSKTDDFIKMLNSFSKTDVFFNDKFVFSKQRIY